METITRKITDRKTVLGMIILCAAVYFVSYLTRINYSAVLVQIISETGLAKTAASMPLTGLFITYGFGQLISGYMGDKFRPEKLIFTGLTLSAAMNVAIAFAHNSVLMTAIWCVNGFAQALMWPPLVKILTTYLTQEDYRRYITYIGYGSSLGTIVVYLFTPAILAVGSYRTVFILCAAVAVGMAFFWIRKIGTFEAKAADTQTTVSAAPGVPGSMPLNRTAICLLVFIMMSICMQGVLRDGISTWMPTYIADVFKFSNSTSILTGVLLPVFSMAMMSASAFLNQKVKNEAASSAIFFGGCILGSLVMCLAPEGNPVLSIIMLMLINGATHGINLMYTSMAVPHFARFGKTSFVTGAINSAVYVGSAISMYGVALITEKFGWGGTMLAWLIVAIVGFALCLPAVRLFVKLDNEEK